MLILLITHRALSEALRPVGRAHVPFIADPKCTAKCTHSVGSQICLQCELSRPSSATPLSSGLGMKPNCELCPSSHLKNLN